LGHWTAIRLMSVNETRHFQEDLHSMMALQRLETGDNRWHLVKLEVSCSCHRGQSTIPSSALASSEYCCNPQAELIERSQVVFVPQLLSLPDLFASWHSVCVDLPLHDNLLHDLQVVLLAQCAASFASEGDQGRGDCIRALLA
jgi:hypothetical protein